MCNNCIHEQLQAERDELRLQVSALTQALETQSRENQPCIKKLEIKVETAICLLERANNVSLPECLQDDIETFFDSLNATGGDKPEQ